MKDRREYYQRWREAHPDYFREYNRSHYTTEQNREKDRRLRQSVIEGYGGRCVCCGENNIRYLQIDHVNNDGVKHRQEIGKAPKQMYLWLKRNGFPVGFQILCANCHNAKTHYGGCQEGAHLRQAGTPE